MVCSWACPEGLGLVELQAAQGRPPSDAAAVSHDRLGRLAGRRLNQTSISSDGSRGKKSGSDPGSRTFYTPS